MKGWIHRCEAKNEAFGIEARCANPAFPLGRFCLSHSIEKVREKIADAAADFVLRWGGHRR